MKIKNVYVLLSFIMFVISVIFFLNFLGDIFHVYYNDIVNMGFIISSTMLFISSIFIFLKGLDQNK